MTLNCPICGSGLAEAFRAIVLHRHEAIYDHCVRCGFLRARIPHWLKEAYAAPIAVTDTGLLLRNTVNARRLSAIFNVIGRSKRDVYLDFAGGFGVLTRMMRDAGFDFYWSDKFSENLMASGFEYLPAMGACRAVTAFEVLEHVVDPRAFVTEALAAGQADTLIFSTELYAGEPPTPGQWWYYSFETGQHISFFRRDTLEVLARELSLHFHTTRGLHFLSRQALPARRIDLVAGRLSPVFALLARATRTTKTQTDHNLMVERMASASATDELSAHRV